MTSPLFLNVNFSLLSPGSSEIGYLLRYDPDSRYTWLATSTLLPLFSGSSTTTKNSSKSITAKRFRQRKVRIPGTSKSRIVDTVLLKVRCGELYSSDEVVVTEKQQDARLGWRTLSALNAFIQRDTSAPQLISGDQSQTKLPHRNAYLLPKSAREPYRDLYHRARKLDLARGEIPLRFFNPITQSSLTRVALVTEAFKDRATNTREISVKSIARQLEFILTKLVKVNSVNVFTNIDPADGWAPIGHSRNYAQYLPKTTKLNRAPADNQHGHTVIIFPSSSLLGDTCSRIACVASPESPTEKLFLDQLFTSLTSVIDVLLIHADARSASIQSQKHARMLLGDSQTRDKNASFEVLRRSKSITPNWERISLWRTSRSSNKLEKHVEEISGSNTRMMPQDCEWSNLNISTRGHKTGVESEHCEYQVFVCPADRFPSLDIKQNQWPAQLKEWIGAINWSDGALFEATETNTKKTAPLNAWVTFPHSPRLINTDRTRAILDNLTRFISHLSYRNNTALLISGAYSHIEALDTARSSSEGATQNQFHLVFSGAIPVDSLDTISLGHLKTFSRGLQLRLPAYNAISWRRYRMRNIGDFLASIHQAQNASVLQRELSKALVLLIGTPEFAIVDRHTKNTLLTSEHLSEWKSTLTIPDLSEGALAVKNICRSLGGAYSQLNKIITAKTPAEEKERAEVPLATGAMFAQISEALVLMVAKYGWAGWNVSSTEYSATRVLASALQLSQQFRSYSTPQYTLAIADSHAATNLPNVAEIELVDGLNTLIVDMCASIASHREQERSTLATLFAVDSKANFVRAVAGNSGKYNLDCLTDSRSITEVVPREAASLVTTSLNNFTTTKEFTPLLGEVIEVNALTGHPEQISGEREESCDAVRLGVRILDHALEPTEPELPFLGLVDGEPGDTILVDGFAKPSGAPHGIIAVNLGTRESLSEDVVKKIISIVRSIGIRVQNYLQHQVDRKKDRLERVVEERFADVLKCDRRSITRLTDLQRRLEETMSAYRSEDLTYYPQGLPPSLLRVITPEYCLALQRVLNGVQQILHSLHMSCRVVYPANSGDDHIYTLASVGDVVAEASVRYDPGENLASYTCESPMLTEEPFQRRRLFVPSNTSSKDLELIYSDMPRDSTRVGGQRSSLVYAFLYYDDDYISTAASRNDKGQLVVEISAKNFLDVWILEEVLSSLASKLATETLLRYRNVEDLDRQALEFSSSLMRSLNHSIARSLEGSQYKNLPYAGLQLEMDVAAKLGRSNTELLSDILRVDEGYCSRICDDEIKIAYAWENSCIDNVRAKESLRSILVKLLIEQVHTFKKLRTDLSLSQTQSSEVSGVEFFIGCRPHEFGEYVIVDILANQVFESHDIEALAPYLFWYRLGGFTETPRPGVGRTGAGLYYIGGMLRSIGVRPSMTYRPDRNILDYHSNMTTQVSLTNMRGCAIQLRVVK